MNDSQPFHAGEVSVQSRLGVHERVAAFGKRLVRDYLTEEHRAFFPLLPSLLIGGRDAGGRLWASMLAGQPGFISSPDEKHLRIAAHLPEGDPLRPVISKAVRLGCLGLQFETRRRNRASGRVEAVDEQGFSLHIDQSFGNCPKYIQTREPELVSAVPGQAEQAGALTEEDRALIRSADTFFIATGIEGDEADPSAGNDVSHRGGKPGFVKLDGQVLTWPDFTGNFMFNTLGNLAIDARAGLLFVDYSTGTSLQLSGRAEVLWDAPELTEFAGAQRFVRFVTERVVRIPNAIPLRWWFGEHSPFNAKTGDWSSG